MTLETQKILSPRRKTSQAHNTDELALEQLAHFGIDADSDYGQALFDAAKCLYQAHTDINRLWEITSETIDSLPQSDRIARFNAKKFLSFQLAKVLDTLQNPFRKNYQALGYSDTTHTAKGPYPIFDNVTALFSATPVIVRTATYIYACTEWVDDAFQGKESTHQIYSRLLNPTSISLANAIVDLECGKDAANYLAWNFNSGMAAIDAVLSNVLNRDDILVVSRNIYGGVHQLMCDHYAKADKWNIQLEWFDGYTTEEFSSFFDKVKQKYQQQLEAGRKIHVYIESPCNPHGYVLDVPGICAEAHKGDHLVMLDSTLATPVLIQPLKHTDKASRPDYVIHSYTKDISGTGASTAGVVIGETYRMFMAKGDEVNGFPWHKTMFWDVYYIKGAFLDSDKAFEVLSGMRTLELRVITKCINTKILTTFLDSHADITVNSNGVPSNSNHKLADKIITDGLPCPLFTLDMEKAGFDRETFTRFFDSLAPTFNHMVSIGQNNTIALCPALTSHSELDAESMNAAGIYPTTIRLAMGNESAAELIAHFYNSATMFLDKAKPGFSDGFMKAEEIDQMIRDCTLEVYAKRVAHIPKMADLLD
ncbi:MAG TPA: Cys/Met metabolism pyridoxal-phosphate-dependent enzyme [Aeromonadales bacterium]|nr:Cys/Met metabolism pyridoxal-phosphate-dependent enzyme [Aeromonadales bacterium]